MRPESEQGAYSVLDIQDQPEGTKVLFLTIGGQITSFQVEGVREVLGQELVANLEAYNGEKVIVQFGLDANWTLVDKAYLEVVTTAQARQRTLEGLPEKIRAGIEYNRIVEDATRGAMQGQKLKENFEDTMRRMLGESGESEVL